MGLSACAEKQVWPELPKTTMAEYTVEVIAGDLDTPWSFAELPQNAGVLIAERGGVLKHVKEGTAAIITGLPDDIYVQGQAGLFDIMLTPDFINTGELYLSYARGTKDANGTAVIKATLKDGALTNISEVFMTDPLKSGFSHFGGVLSYVPGGAIALGLGEGFEFREAAQDPNSDLGKIIKIYPPKAQIISKGHRNVQGLFFDPLTFTLWSHEHGPRGGDELNIIRPSNNYGWPMVSGGLDYNGARITPLTEMEGVEPAVYGWTPSIAPSGLVVYRGNMFPDWAGDIFVGGLASKDVRRLDFEDGKIVGEEIILSDINARIRDVNMAFDGALLVLAVEEGNSRLLRVTPKE